MTERQNEDAPLGCLLCTATFKTQKEKKRHYNKYHAHQEHPTKAMYCGMCGSLYMKKGHLINHVREQHPSCHFDEETNMTTIRTGPGEDTAPPTAAVVDVDDVPEVDARSEAGSTTEDDAGAKQDDIAPSVRRCIEAQKKKIHQMELLMDEHMVEASNLQKRIADHEAIVTTLEADLPSTDAEGTER